MAVQKKEKRLPPPENWKIDWQKSGLVDAAHIVIFLCMVKYLVTESG